MSQKRANNRIGGKALGLAAIVLLPLLAGQAACDLIEQSSVTVDAVTPGYGNNTGTVTVRITGSGFAAGATASLEAAGKETIYSTAIRIDSETQVTATFDLDGASTGARTVKVKNPDDQSGTLKEGFIVLKPTALYAACYVGRSVVVYNEGDVAAGFATPDRIINHPQVGEPTDVFLDTQRNLLYVADGEEGQILVFGNGRTVTGSTPPDRTITSSALFFPSSIWVDEAHDQLYVAESEESSILVFSGASQASGDVAPARTITGSGVLRPHAVLLDAANNRLYVANGNSLNYFISVFDNASAINGNTTPTRTITSAELYPDPSDLALDPTRHVLYVSVSTMKHILIYQNAETVSGSATPSTTLTLSQTIHGLWVDPAKDILFASHDGGLTVGSGSILVFESASKLTSAGNPARQIGNLTMPKGLWGSSD